MTQASPITVHLSLVFLKPKERRLVFYAGLGPGSRSSCTFVDCFEPAEGIGNARGGETSQEPRVQLDLVRMLPWTSQLWPN